MFLHFEVFLHIVNFLIGPVINQILDEPVFSIWVSGAIILPKSQRINWYTSTKSTIVSTVNFHYLGINTLDKPVISSIKMSDATILTEAMDEKLIKIGLSKTLTSYTKFKFRPSLKTIILLSFICTLYAILYNLRIKLLLNLAD